MLTHLAGPDALIRLATPEDIRAVCAAIRWQDRAELHATGETVDEWRARIIADPPGEVWYSERAGKPLGLFGCWRKQQGLAVFGQVWALFTRFVRGNEIYAAKVARGAIEIWRQEFTVLGNYVHEPHLEAQRWLELVGFELGTARAWGPRRRSFRPFAWRGPWSWELKPGEVTRV